MPNKMCHGLSKLLAQAISLILLYNALPAFATPSYIITDLGTLGGSFSSGNAINNLGQVAGASSLSSDLIHAFVWQNGAIQDLGTLGGVFSNAGAINDNGQIVGQAATTTDPVQAFSWQNGTMTNIGPTTGISSAAAGVAAATPRLT